MATIAKVTTNNRLDKSFGPVGSSAGVMLFVAGLIITCFYSSGLILVFIGAFVGFTYSANKSSVIATGFRAVFALLRSLLHSEISSLFYPLSMAVFLEPTPTD